MTRRPTPSDGRVSPDATHGGDVEGVAREHGLVADDLLDFSASINPIGPPARAMARLLREAGDVQRLAHYPDPTCSELRGVLAAQLNVCPECLTIANGSAALIGAAVRAIAPRTCLLMTPAFGEQRRVLAGAGCRIDGFALNEAEEFVLDVDAFCAAIETGRPDLCLLTNPHNPSGRLIPRPEMARIIGAAERVNTPLIVDEAFIDFAPADSVTSDAIRSAHLVVLRSLTKFYGMPSLRVGYSVSTPAMAARCAAELPAWPVTTLAATAAAEALQDREYADRTRARVNAERRWLSDALANIGVKTYPSAANFLLLRLPAGGPDSILVRDRLIRERGIVVRDCRSFEGLEGCAFVRVAVRCRNDNERLVRALPSLLARSEPALRMV